MKDEQKRVLLTGGRSFVALDLARQLARSGHTIIVAESIPVHLCRYSQKIQKNYLVPAPNSDSAAYIDALISIIQGEEIDLLIPTCEEIFFIAGALERLCVFCQVFVEPLTRLQRLHSKWEFNQLAYQYGLRVPQTHLITSQDDLRRFININTTPFVLKPVFSRFATNVFIIKSTEQTNQLLEKAAISPEYPWIAQEYIEGKLFCSYSIAHKGHLAAHVVYMEDFTAGLTTCINFAPVDAPLIDQWVARFVSLEGFTGQIAFDFMLTETGELFPLECNPRATSGLHLFRHAPYFSRLFFGQGEGEQSVLKPGPTAQAMIAPAMLVYGLPATRSWHRLKEWLHVFLHARDVIFDARDVKPFLAQPLILWSTWRASRIAGTSLLAFSTRDIEWNGGLEMEKESAQ